MIPQNIIPSIFHEHLEISNMIDIGQTLKVLSSKRPIFHSEADFQQALAWQIHEEYPTCSIRLERKVTQLDNTMYVDIWATENDANVAIETKYRTKLLEVIVDREQFDLLNRGGYKDSTLIFNYR